MPARYRALLPAVSVLLLASCATVRNNPDEEVWIDLFNGKNLEGWTPKIRGYEAGVNYGNTFRVEDGVLKVSYDEYDAFGDRFGHLFYEKPFSYYRLRVEYRFVGEQAPGGQGWATRNSGMMLHGQTPESMLTDQNFPVSIEVQLLGGLGKGKRTTANLCTPGTHVFMADTLFTPHCINSSSETYDGDVWVSAEVLVLGDSLIRHYVEGRPVLEYTRPQIGGGQVDPVDPAVKQDGRLLNRGTISLQSESHPVAFRRVQLLDLAGCTDPRAVNYKRYVVRSEPGACRYR